MDLAWVLFLKYFTGSCVINTKHKNATAVKLKMLHYITVATRRDCTEERKRAEDMDKMDPEGGIFIPECLHGGDYRPEQCHKGTGYCWCVDTKTGKPIKAPVTQHEMPDCSKVASKNFKGKVLN